MGVHMLFLSSRHPAIPLTLPRIAGLRRGMATWWSRGLSDMVIFKVS